MGAMGEGFGDYLAASFYAGAGDVTYQSSNAACVGEWDASSYSSTSPPCLRRVDGTKTHPADVVGAVHADGEIWSAALGYLLLDLLGWKIFTLLVVLPVSLPPIFMLHNCFGESPSCNLKSVEDESEKSVPKFISRAIKLVLFFTVTSLQGWLSIILAPKIIQQQNIRQAEASSSCYLTVTQTTEFLFLFLLVWAIRLTPCFVYRLKRRRTLYVPRATERNRRGRRRNNDSRDGCGVMNPRRGR